MKIKLKESIRANGIQYLPPSVVDADEIGITQADVDVLVRRGTAELVEAEASVEVAAKTEEVAEQVVEASADNAEAKEATAEKAPSKRRKGNGN